MTRPPLPPPSMRTLERDPRGYPIPFIVLRDRSGAAHFPVSDVRRVNSCLTKRLCGICGKRLDRTCWFVGGDRCFTHPAGAFVDPPSHWECAIYALSVCPFLAAPSYSRRIDGRKLNPGEMPIGTTVVKETTMPDTRPDLFGLGETTAFRVTNLAPGSWVLAPETWEYVEYWAKGERAAAPAAG